MTTLIQGDSIRTVTEGIRVTRATAALPQTTVSTLFTVTGRIRVVSIIGEVTTVIQTQLNNTKLLFNPDGAGADTDLCAVLDITADAVGTMYSITGTPATALQDGLWVITANKTIPAPGLVVQAGAIQLSCSASNTGSVAWELIYRPLSAGATVVAA